MNSVICFFSKKRKSDFTTETKRSTNFFRVSSMRKTGSSILEKKSPILGEELALIKRINYLLKPALITRLKGWSVDTTQFVADTSRYIERGPGEGYS